MIDEALVQKEAYPNNVNKKKIKNTAGANIEFVSSLKLIQKNGNCNSTNEHSSQSYRSPPEKNKTKKKTHIQNRNRTEKKKKECVNIIYQFKPVKE